MERVVQLIDELEDLIVSLALGWRTLSRAGLAVATILVAILLFSLF